MFKWLSAACVLLAGVWSCAPTNTSNPYVALTDVVLGGTAGGSNDNNGGGSGGGGGVSAPVFRRSMTLTFTNNHPDADLDVSFIAWVSPGSIRSADQQDVLLSNNYVQLSRELHIGTVFSLAPGTFVYNGTGVAGATPVHLRGASAATAGGAAEPTMAVFTLITPDAILAYTDPPVSCNSVAFTYSRNGSVITDDFVGGPTGPFTGANLTGGYKTLSQVDVYQCDPLRPGLFLKLGAGQRANNEFFEGQSVDFSFDQMPDADGNFAHVAIQ